MPAEGGHINTSIDLPGDGAAKNVDVLALAKLNATLEGFVYELRPGVQNADKIGRYWNLGMLKHMPSVGVQPKSVEDIRKAIKFASEQELQVNVKVNGHSYAGQAAGEGMMIIWMGKNFNKARLVHDYKDTCGKIYADTLYVEGGAAWADAYAAIGPDHIGPGGTCESVGGAGGWILGTGLSFEQQRTLGLGSDLVIDFNVVTADGVHRRVDACSDPELFKILRGGGGGFAVIVSLHYRIDYGRPMTEFTIGFNRTLYSGEDAWWRFYVRWVIEADNRWNLYSWNTWDNNQAPNGRLITEDLRDFFILSFWFMDSSKVAKKTKLWNGLNDLFQAVPKKARYRGSGEKEYPNFQNYKITTRIKSLQEERDYRDKRKNFRPYVGNRLIPALFFRQYPEQAVKLLKKLDGKHCDHFYHLGGQVAANGMLFPGDTFVNPNLRSAILQIGMCDEKIHNEVAEQFNNSVGGMGINHAGWHIDDWKEAGWGKENYEILLGLKKKWDPDKRFWCRHCVGSDEL